MARQTAGSFLTFLLELSIFYFLTEFLGIYYIISSVVGFLLANSFLYLLSVRWIFTARNIGNRGVEFVLFLTISGFALLLNTALLFLLVNRGQIHYLIAKIVAAAVVFFANFFIKRVILFRQNTP